MLNWLPQKPGKHLSVAFDFIWKMDFKKKSAFFANLLSKEYTEGHDNLDSSQEMFVKGS